MPSPKANVSSLATWEAQRGRRLRLYRGDELDTCRSHDVEPAEPVAAHPGWGLSVAGIAASCLVATLGAALLVPVVNSVFLRLANWTVTLSGVVG